MKTRYTRQRKQQGSVLALVVILTVLLTLTGFAILRVAEGRSLQAVRIKNQESASSAAEAGYEKAIFWMGQQVDMLTSLTSAEKSGSLNFAQSSADYDITLASFVNSCPVFKIQSTGFCGIYQKTIDAYVVQAVAGWEMGQCRIPSNPTQTAEVSFVSGEIIAMPIHINKLDDNPDKADIYISGSPSFWEHVSMGEARYTSGGTDKYSKLINVFTKGISFSQPASRIYDSDVVAAKVELFRETTNPTYRFTPTKSALPKSANGRTGFYSATVTNLPAVHLKFYVNAAGQGYVRIYNNCTVAGYTRSGTTWDYKIDPSNPARFVQYPIYGCHYNAGPLAYTDVRIDNPTDPIFVRQTYGGTQSEPGAQIYVDGNVIIGCASEDTTALGTVNINTVKSRITVVATGNIWLANELKVDGTRDAAGMPAADNPNVIGLVTQGVIKIVDSGMTTNDQLYNSSYFKATDVANYAPIGIKEGTKLYDRQMPYNMVAEAAITVGGGGWGAENVYRSRSYTPRENVNSSKNDKLIVRGSITEVCRGVVGSGNNGYLKQYYFDKRLMTGITPGNMGLKGKYLLIPGGWSETSSVTSQ
jgi:Tfp pilus assembly protein PilX